MESLTAYRPGRPWRCRPSNPYTHLFWVLIIVSSLWFTVTMADDDVDIDCSDATKCTASLTALQERFNANMSDYMSKQQSLQQSVTGLTTDVEDLTTDVEGLTTDVGGLTTDVGGLTTDVGDVTQDLTEHQADLAAHQKKVQEDIDTRTSAIESTALAAVATSRKALEEDIDTVQEQVAQVETKARDMALETKTLVDTALKELQEQQAVPLAGISIANALSSIPYAPRAEKDVTFGLGLGYFEKQTALATGVELRRDWGSLRAGVGVSMGEIRKVGAHLGIAW